MTLIDRDALISKYSTHHALCDKVNKMPAIKVAEIQEQMCEKYCRFPRDINISQEDLDLICSDCPLGRIGENK